MMLFHTQSVFNVVLQELNPPQTRNISCTVTDTTNKLTDFLDNRLLQNGLKMTLCEVRCRNRVGEAIRPTQGPSWGYFKSQFATGLSIFTKNTTKWLQGRGNGSNNEDGMPPRRAFCGPQPRHL